MRGFELVASAVADQGVHTMFGLIGDGNLFMVDAFVRNHSGRFVSVANETAAVLAANGYARVTGSVGVVSITHGPALTNTITALIESVKDRTPLLVIVGDTAAADTDNLQDIDQRLVIEPAGAGFEQLRTPESIVEDVTYAMSRALTESRPIVLNVPIDFTWAVTQLQNVKPLPPGFPGHCDVIPDGDLLEQAAAVIATADRPVILAGRGAISPSAQAALLELSTIIGAPLGTTLRARELFSAEEYNLGIIGTLAHNVAAETVARADVLIAFGASLNPYTTAERAFVTDKRVIQIDRDASALNRYQSVDVPVHGDAASAARGLSELLRAIDADPTGFASPELRKRLSSASYDRKTVSPQAETIDMQDALQSLDQLFPAERTLVIDGGRFLDNAFKFVHVTHPREYIHTLNFGAIGLGMGNALGAASVSTKPTLLIIGDGGFMLGGLNEFNTAVRHGLNLTVALINDGAYGAEHIQFRAKDMSPEIAMFDWPSFAEVATSLGGHGHTVRNLLELEHALSQRVDGIPMLLDILIDPDTVS